ncbi:hypothetical protein ABPG72_016548 [Tetrahymena utriculariae]
MSFLPIACLFDPRFKSLSFINDQQMKDQAINNLEREFITESEKQQQKQKDLINKPCSENAVTQNSIFGKRIKIQNISEIKICEINTYLSLSEISEKDDPFKWWKANQNKFKVLSTISRRYLCVPASSIPSERLFSKTGYILNKQRNKLKEKRLEKLVFLFSNHKYINLC